MLKPLLTLLCSCALTLAYSQEFTYSFNGNLSIDDLVRLKDSLSQLPISSDRIALKQEQEVGYLTFYCEENTNGENTSLFSLVDIKKTLIEFGLFPQQCTMHFNKQKP